MVVGGRCGSEGEQGCCSDLTLRSNIVLVDARAGPRLFGRQWAGNASFESNLYWNASDPAGAIVRYQRPSLGRGQSSLWYRESVCSFARRPRAGRCGVGAPRSASAAAPTHPKGSTSAERSIRHGKAGRAGTRTQSRRLRSRVSKAMPRQATSAYGPTRRRLRWASTRRHRRRGVGSAHGHPS